MPTLTSADSSCVFSQVAGNTVIATTQKRYHLSILCDFHGFQLVLLILEYADIPLSCSFDDGWCGFTQAADDDMDWTRHKLATPSRDSGIITGPETDHTQPEIPDKGRPTI